MPPDTGLLVARLRARDPRAARQAWLALSPFVLSLLRRFAGAGLDREDLCQEVFLRFFARIDELRNPRALRSFVAGICIGVAHNERRRAYVRRVVGLADDGETPDMAVAGADPAVVELTGRLHDLLTRAHPGDRHLFLMRYAEEMDVAEVAAAQGIALSTVRRRLGRTTRRIVLRLADGWGRPGARRRSAA